MISVCAMLRIFIFIFSTFFFSTFRWAQVTDELKEALWELEAEKEKRRRVEEELNTRAQEQDSLKNKLSALMEEKQLHNQQVQLHLC